MKSHSKVGNKPGQPAYRTPSEFRVQKNLQVNDFKSQKNNFKNSRPTKIFNRGK
jgi:hypothetical protein